MQPNKKPLPPLNALRAFEAAARLRNLTRAAEELHVTQAAVSQQVKLLEDYLGAPLFNRTARRLQLTDLAKAYLPVLSEAFAKVHASTQELFDTSHRSIIHIRSGTSFAQRWLVPRLPDFAKKHPEFGFRLQTTIWPTTDTTTDLEFCHGYGDYSGLLVKRILNEHWVVVCSPEFLAERGPFEKIEHILTQPLISTMGYKEGWHTWCSAQGLTTEIPISSYESDNTTMALDMTLAGMGIMLSLDTHCHEYLKQGQLVKVSEFELAAQCGHYLVLPNRPVPPKVKVFCEWLVDQLEEQTGNCGQDLVNHLDGRSSRAEDN